MYHVEYNPDDVTAKSQIDENALKNMTARVLKRIDTSSEVGTASDWDCRNVKVFVGGAEIYKSRGKPYAILDKGAFAIVPAVYVENESRPGKNCYKILIANSNVKHDFKINRCDVVFYCNEGDSELYPRRVGTFYCDYQVRPIATDGFQEIEVKFFIDRESIDLDGQFFCGSDNLPKSSHDIATKEQE